MLKNGSSFSDPRVLTPVRYPPAQQEVFLGAVMRVRSRWPFTVEAVDGAKSQQSVDSPSTEHKESSSFVT